MRKVVSTFYIVMATCAMASCQTADLKHTSDTSSSASKVQDVDVAQNTKNFKFINRTPGKKICKKVTESGSRLQTETICKSEKEWRAASDAARNGVLEMQHSFNGAESP